MKIIVTGGAGFIGSHVVDAYIGQGHEVVVLDSLVTGSVENLNPRAKFHKIDVRSEEILRVFKQEKPDVLNHHAAQVSVPASVRDPVNDADVNVRGFLNLLESARSVGVKKIISVSSVGVYGEAAEYPTTENCPRRPLSPYTITKSVSEEYLPFYRGQYGIDYTVFRYANIYGPRQAPHGEAGVVAIFFDNILNNRKCSIYRYDDEPGGMTRDYCFVSDVAAANLLALKNGGGRAYNIATGIETDTRTLFDHVYDAAKEAMPDIPRQIGEPEFLPARPSDLKKSCLVIDKAGRELSWKPEIVVREGIRKTLKWYLAAIR